MSRPLNGLTILIPESRELDLFANLLEAEGAVTERCPLVRIVALDESADAEARDWVEQLIAAAFQDVILLTGEGLRRLLAIAERMHRRADFIGALARVRTITRGPKPVRALREIGLAPGLAALIPTSQGVIDVLAREDIDGRAIGVQLYPGDGAGPLLAQLAEMGARVFPVTPYRYASHAETSIVENAIRKLHAGQIGVIAFTSSPQVERLIKVASDAGLRAELNTAFSRVQIAAIGPIVEETLRYHGVMNVLRPDSSFHLKPFIRTIVAAWRAK